MKSCEEIWKIGLDHKIQQKKVEFFPFMELLLQENVKNIMEIGMCYGGSTVCFANLADVVIGIDVPITANGIPTDVLRSYCDFRHVIGNTHDDSTVELTRQTLNGLLVDMLFIDGDHGAVGVWQDFNKFSPFVKSGGLVAFHDIADSVEHRSVGVNLVEVYNELVKTHRHTEFMEPGGLDCGIGVIWL